MIDPLERWREYGEKPDYAGPLSFGGAPLTQDPALLAGFDVAIVGAPTDDLVSDRPGARFGPRAIRAASCPPGPHLEVEGRRVRRAADRRLRRRAGAARRSRALARGDRGDGGRGRRRRPHPDRPRRRPLDRRAGRARVREAGTGRVGLVHFDTHTDTGDAGVRRRALARHADVPTRAARASSTRSATCRSGCAATGPASRSSHGRPSTGSRRSSCTTCATLGIARRGRADDPARRRGAGVPDRRRRRARSGVRARHRHARAGRHDERRAARSRARGRPAARARRRRRRRGDPDGGRLRRRDGARRATGSSGRS